MYNYTNAECQRMGIFTHLYEKFRVDETRSDVGEGEGLKRGGMHEIAKLN